VVVLPWRDILEPLFATGPVLPERRIGVGPNSDGLFQGLIALGARVEGYEASVRAIRRH
jgi:hypothetical protein